MRNDWLSHGVGAPVRTTPVWVSALQAAGIGMIAGLALYAIMSMAVLQAGGRGPAHAAPRECKKASPAREVTVPALEGPAVSSVRLVVSGRL